MTDSDRYLTVTLTAKEFSAIAGVVNVFFLEHPRSKTAQDAFAAYREMCRQVNHDPEPGMTAAREGLEESGAWRLWRWMGGRR